MKPEYNSLRLLGVARAKAKMYEYQIDEEEHIAIQQDPTELFVLSIGALGDMAAQINRGEIDTSAQEVFKNNLIFSAQFFDSYLQSKLNQDLDPYLMLLGAASYYLCDLPGSASILAKHLDGKCLDLDCDGLEDLLLWLLQSDFNIQISSRSEYFRDLIEEIAESVIGFFSTGNGRNDLINLSKKNRAYIYNVGTPRQLLFIDVIDAIINKKISNSCWITLPKYSELSIDKWRTTIKKEKFIKELWPAQHILGEKGVLKGKSAIVQMPTSSGKTKAIELILRSAFFANRAYLAVIIAPFKALCNEIKNDLIQSFYNESVKINEFSDVLQMDIFANDSSPFSIISNKWCKELFDSFDISNLQEQKHIIISTPEKLIYVLRHIPELSSHIGLVVLDEGHQFDNDTRGINYELLLTLLRSKLPEGTQKILISAVINNADDISLWLNKDANIVNGHKLISTFRTVGFASWSDTFGKIEYVNPRNPEMKDFFVPRVINYLYLRKNKKERVQRIFPKRNNGQDIALYLGMKIVTNGSVAIFCGKKESIYKICKRVVEIFNRGVELVPPVKYSNKKEISALLNLYIDNFGENSILTKSAELGVFSHCANMPNGIRLAVEHAMHKNFIKFIICTSTLAQGVNLPIRYLIITSIYQSKNIIKVRDFQNLIGRTGRSGIYTEGSIIFSDPAIFDNKNKLWNDIKGLLDVQKIEPCISNLLLIFDPIKINKEILPIDIFNFVLEYLNNRELLYENINNIAIDYIKEKFYIDELNDQIDKKIKIINAIESFLLYHWDDVNGGSSEDDISSLAESTFAYFLADERQKENIKKIFNIIANNIYSNIKDKKRRRIYGRTLYDIQNSIYIENWTRNNIELLLQVVDDLEFIKLILPLFHLCIKNNTFNNFDSENAQIQAINLWLSGESFFNILTSMQYLNVYIKHGSQKRECKMDNIIDICEYGFAYEGSLILGAVCEMIDLIDIKNNDTLVRKLMFFQKRMKYGLPTNASIAVYELGISDRVIAQDFTKKLGLTYSSKEKLIEDIKIHRDNAIKVLQKYPSYFHNKLNDILNIL